MLPVLGLDLGGSFCCLDSVNDLGSDILPADIQLLNFFLEAVNVRVAENDRITQFKPRFFGIR